MRKFQTTRRITTIRRRRRRGIVVVETAIVLVFIVVPMAAIAVLGARGGLIRYRSETAIAVTRIAIANGETDAIAAAKGAAIMSSINGTLSVDGDSIDTEATISVMGKIVPVRATMPR